MFQRTAALRSSLAATIGLWLVTGCAQPTAPQPVATGPAPKLAAPVTASAQSPAAAQPITTAPAVKPPAAAASFDANAGAAVNTALAAETDLVAYDAIIADPSGTAGHFGVLSTAASSTPSASPSASPKPSPSPSPKPSPSATPVVAKAKPNFTGTLTAAQKAAQAGHDRQRSAAAKGRSLVERQAILRAASGPYASNKDGTASKTLNFDVPVVIDGQKLNRHVTMTRIASAKDGSLLSVHVEMSEHRPDGSTHLISQDKSLQADGSYDLVTHTELTSTDKHKTTTDVDAVVATDGTLSGNGSLTGLDAKGQTLETVTLSVSGSDLAPKLAPAS